jgi:hypothetical protein
MKIMTVPERSDFESRDMFVKLPLFRKSVNLYITVSCSGSYIWPKINENKLARQILLETPNTEAYITEGRRQMSVTSFLCSHLVSSVREKKKAQRLVVNNYSVWQSTEFYR